MDCKTARNLLEAYLDNELDRATARALETHADACPDCSAELGRLDELRRALRDQALRYHAPASLQQRIRMAAAAGNARRTLPAWMRLAAACVLAFGAGAVSMQWWHSTPAGDATTQIAGDLFAAHWRALAATTPVDVVSSDRHTVKPWFAGKVATAPVVEDFVAQGYALVGGRIDYAGNARVPVLVYRHGQHLIDVFVLPTSIALPGSSTRQGYALASVTLGQQPAVVVSDMDQQELAAFARLLAAAK